MGVELVGELPEGVRWWAVDLPGHGESAWTPGEYGVETVGAAVVEWATREIGEAAWWYGHSYGGQVALGAVGVAPGLCAGLIIGDAPLAPEAMYTQLELGADRLRRWRQWCGLAETELVGLLGAEPLGERTFAELLGPDHPYLRNMASSLHRHDPAYLTALLEEPETVYASLASAATWLAALEGRVLLLRGDPAAGAMTTENDAALVRGAGGTVRTLRGIGHELHHAAPAAVAAALAEFMK